MGKKKTIIEEEEIFIDIEIDHINRDQAGKVSSKEPSVYYKLHAQYVRNRTHSMLQTARTICYKLHAQFEFIALYF